jgi:tetratricopeptide (TPR) repeat protein
VILAELGLSDAAIAAYRRAIVLDDRAFAARNNLALILAEQESLDAGLEVAQKAYALADTNPNVIDTLGWLYLKKGLTERSVALLEKACALDPQLPISQLHLALAYREAGRREDARRLLADLVRRDGVHAEIAGQASEALRSLGG